jgi:cytochrome P450
MAHALHTAAQTILPAPPTMTGLPILGKAIDFMVANGIPVELLANAQREHGDVVHFTVMNRNMYLVSDPELVQEILVKRVADFHKPEAILEKPLGLSRFLGKGILLAGYEAWKPQRKLIQPLMHRKHIEAYADTMGAMGEHLLHEWHDGAQRDIHADMTDVTMWIIAKTMFGIEAEANTDFENVVSTAQQIVIQDIISLFPAWLGRDARAKEANQFMTDFVQRTIAERQNDDSERNDLLSLLLSARDEDGNAMSEDLLRDNILTMFFAGHETTANTLTWAHYYLAQNPAVLAQLQAEVDNVLADGHTPTLDDLPHLPYTQMVIKETMRIQPTVPVVPRVIVEDTALGGYTLKGESIIFISPYVLHHDARYWDAPDIFDPTRFSAENEPNIGKYNYLPFGGGPRVCIGNHFAMMEAQILLAMMVRQYELELAPNAKIEPLHQVTTYPKHGLPMRLKKR